MVPNLDYLKNVLIYFHAALSSGKLCVICHSVKHESFLFIFYRDKLLQDSRNFLCNPLYHGIHENRAQFLIYIFKCILSAFWCQRFWIEFDVLVS